MSARRAQVDLDALFAEATSFKPRDRSVAVICGEFIAREAVGMDGHAAAALRAVRRVMGVFSRHALMQALASPGAATTIADNIGKEHAEAARTLREGLDRFGLQLEAFTPGRTKFARISAVGPARMIVPEATPNRVMIYSNSTVRARVYVAPGRRTGQAYFLAGGFQEDTESVIYLFVLPSEDRYWVAAREDLLQYDEELRAEAKGQRGRKRYGKSGFTPHSGRKGYMLMPTI